MKISNLLKHFANKSIFLVFKNGQNPFRDTTDPTDDDVGIEGTIIDVDDTFVYFQGFEDVICAFTLDSISSFQDMSALDKDSVSDGEIEELKEVLGMKDKKPGSLN